MKYSGQEGEKWDERLERNMRPISLTGKLLLLHKRKCSHLTLILLSTKEWIITLPYIKINIGIGLIEYEVVKNSIPTSRFILKQKETIINKQTTKFCKQRATKIPLIQATAHGKTHELMSGIQCDCHTS